MDVLLTQLQRDLGCLSSRLETLKSLIPPASTPNNSFIPENIPSLRAWMCAPCDTIVNTIARNFLTQENNMAQAKYGWFLDRISS